MLRTICSLLAIILISACSASYEKIKNVESQKNNSFSASLLKAYKEKAIFEAEEMHDWNSAKLYSEKALEALEGKEVKPQKIQYWKLSNEYISDLSYSYNNLMEIYDDAKIVDHHNLAKAISSLDCWAEQQEEDWQTWDINKCKEDFINAMHVLYEKIVNNKNNTSIKKNNKNLESVSVVTKNEKKEIMQIIYFDFDESILSQISIQTINKFLNKNKKLISNFVIIGHADTKGSNKYNLELSLKRAEAVKNILLNNGIKQNKISILGRGEEFLAIKTADNVAHPANRRAIIRNAN